MKAIRSGVIVFAKCAAFPFPSLSLSLSLSLPPPPLSHTLTHSVSLSSVRGVSAFCKMDPSLHTERRPVIKTTCHTSSTKCLGFLVIEGALNINIDMFVLIAVKLSASC